MFSLILVLVILFFFLSSDAAVMNDLGTLPLESLQFEKIQMFANKIIESAKIDFTKADASDIAYLGALTG